MNKSYLNNPKVSVIVSVYKPGEFLLRCLESLKNQTLKDIEFIFVDDCGNDGSIENIKEFFKDDFRVVIINNEENLGPGPSRNKGIELAKGEYLSFIDADDYVSDDYYELLYKDAIENDADIAKGSLVTLGDNNSIVGKSTLNQLIIDGLKKGTPLYSLFSYEHTTGLYKREFLLNNNLRYPSSRKGADPTFLLYVCSTTKKDIVIVDEAKYYYHKNTNSITNTYNESTYRYQIESLSDQTNYVATHVREDEYLYRYIYRRIQTTFRGLESYRQFGGNISFYNDCIKEIVKHLRELSFNNALLEKYVSIDVLENYNDILIDPSLFSIKDKDNRDEILQKWISVINKNNLYDDKYIDSFKQVMNTYGKLISVLIPTYNNGKTIEQCVDSVLNQKYKNIEIVVVDESSTDKTEEICKDYVDKRVKYHQIKDSNDFNVKNTCLEKANGSYLIFIDANDYVRDDYIEKLYMNLLLYNSDISACNYVGVKGNNEPVFNSTVNIKEFNVPLTYLSSVNMLNANSLWNKLFKKNLFDNLSFKNDCVYDDGFIVHYVIGNADKLVNTTEQLYVRRAKNPRIKEDTFTRYDEYKTLYDRIKYLDEKGMLKERNYWLNKTMDNLSKSIEISKKDTHSEYWTNLFYHCVIDLVREYPESKKYIENSINIELAIGNMFN